MKSKSKIFAAALITSTFFAISGFVSAAPAHAASPCGWTADETWWFPDEYAEAGTYTHCGDGNMGVKVQHTYAERDICVTPGETRLFADPAIGAITFAYATDPC